MIDTIKDSQERIRALHHLWLQEADDEALQQELRAIQKDSAAIYDRFYRTLTFGTGGLRGIMGAGPNRMNIYIVREVTRALAGYLLQRYDTPSVAIAWDSRTGSRRFADEAAQMLAGCGITVYRYARLAPTPMLSFAVRRLGCGAGIMITASHNPAQYNGYKVYGADGCQITPGAAQAISQQMNLAAPFCEPAQVMQAMRGTVHTIDEAVWDDYYHAVLQNRLEQVTPAMQPIIVYTPLHGTGGIPVTAALTRAGYQKVKVVASQWEPDGSFPTCATPNPELPGALEEGLKLCRTLSADLLLATDPDCDRVGVAARQGDGYHRLSGNEVGVLLLDYICAARLRHGIMPQNPVAVNTIVTTPMARRVAHRYGVQLRQVLTGFKFIGELIGKLEQAGQASRYILGFEESCGYLSGSYVRDKDGVNACLLIADMATYYYNQRMTLAEAMEALYQEYGYYLTALETMAMDGEAGMRDMRWLMEQLRAGAGDAIFAPQSASLQDFMWGEDDQDAPLRLPSSDVLQYRLEDGTEITVRPSGTEPMLKVYYSVCCPTREQAKTALEDYKKRVSTFIGQALKRRAVKQS